MNIIQFLNSQFFRQVLLIVLLTLAVFFAATGGFQNPQWSDLLGGIAVSVLSTVVSIYFLQGVEKKSVDTGELVQAIHESLSKLNQSHFVRADRNMDMGDEYWISLIDELGSTSEPVWFVGTRLSWWLKTGTYRGPLRAKFLQRLKAISNMDESTGYDDTHFMAFFLLANPDWVANWKDFFQNIISELTENKVQARKKQLQELYWSKIKIATLPPEMIRYSLILCGNRLTVTHYTTLGRSEDSPTLEIQSNSVIRQLYIDDLRILKGRANFSDSQKT